MGLESPSRSDRMTCWRWRRRRRTPERICHRVATATPNQLPNVPWVETPGYTHTVASRRTQNTRHGGRCSQAFRRFATSAKLHPARRPGLPGNVASRRAQSCTRHGGRGSQGTSLCDERKAAPGTEAGAPRERRFATSSLEQEARPDRHTQTVASRRAAHAKRSLTKLWQTKKKTCKGCLRGLRCR